MKYINMKQNIFILFFSTVLLLLSLSHSIADSNTLSKTGVDDRSGLSETDYGVILKMISKATKSGIQLYYNDKSCNTKFFNYDKLYVSLYDNAGSACLLICAEPFVNDNWFVGRSHKIWGNYVLSFDTAITGDSVDSLEALGRSLISAGANILDEKKVEGKGNYNFAIGRCERLKK